MSEKSNFQYLIDGFKWLVGIEDKKCRFNDLEEVKKFVGKLKNFNTELVEKWFYIVDRKEMFSYDKKVVKKYEEMIKHFELFVDSLFVVNNYESDTNDKSSEYINEFEELLKSFESIVCESISKKIDSERQIRSRIKSSKIN